MTRIEENIEVFTKIIQQKTINVCVNLPALLQVFQCMRELEVQIQSLTKRIDELEKK